MTRFSKVAIISAALCATAFSPTAALAKSGYMTCLLHKDNNGVARTYYTYPFQADSGDEDAMTALFQRVSIESDMLLATDQTIGGCHWEAKRNDAFAVAKGFLAKYRGNEFDFSRAMESKLKGR